MNSRTFSTQTHKDSKIHQEDFICAFVLNYLAKIKFYYFSFKNRADYFFVSAAGCNLMKRNVNKTTKINKVTEPARCSVNNFS